MLFVRHGRILNQQPWRWLSKSLGMGVTSRRATALRSLGALSLTAPRGKRVAVGVPREPRVSAPHEAILCVGRAHPVRSVGQQTVAAGDGAVSQAGELSAVAPKPNRFERFLIRSYQPLQHGD